MRLDKITKELDESIFVLLPQDRAWDITIIDVLMILYSRSIKATALGRIDDLRKMRDQIIKYPFDWEKDRTPVEEME